ncbi:MAG: hypothetical protein ISR69_12820 [Gammaproteobacteria bacterium]|nr:hypothetical protein [Gammaproteobacteria bacterium]
MKNSLLILPLLCASTFSVQANDFEAALSSKAAQFSMYSDSSVIGWGGSDLALRFMYNEDDDFLAQAEVLSVRPASEGTPLTLGVGLKAYAGVVSTDKNILSIGVGGSIQYVIPATMPVTAYGNLFYSPEITSFSDAETIRDFNIGVQVEAMPQTKMFIGYRNLKLDTDTVKGYRLDDKKIHFGVRFTF